MAAAGARNRNKAKKVNLTGKNALASMTNPPVGVRSRPAPMAQLSAEPRPSPRNRMTISPLSSPAQHCRFVNEEEDVGDEDGDDEDEEADEDVSGKMQPSDKSPSSRSPLAHQASEGLLLGATLSSASNVTGGSNSQASGMYATGSNSQHLNVPGGTSSREAGHVHAHDHEEHVHVHKRPRHSMFMDATQMKQQIKENLCKSTYDVHDFYHESGCFVTISKSPAFEYAALCVISTNALWISIDTDWNDEPVLLAADPIFQVAENAFCALFSLEWIIRLMAFREKRYAFKDYWFLFDTVLVSMMVMETWVLSLLIAASGGQSANIGDAAVLRMVRLLRLTRVARLARLLRAVPELMILIKGMVAATRSVFFTLVLLVSAIYVFAIAFVQLSEGSDVGVKYFKTTPDAMFTLLLRGTYLDEVTEFVTDLKLHEQYWLLIGLFLLFVLLAAQTLMNMLIGVLCEVVSVVAAAEKEELQMSAIVSRLSFIMEDLDEDGDRSISREEFLQLLSHPEAAEALTEFGVDPVSLVGVASFLFPSDDEDGEECEPSSLSFEDFIDVVLQFRGTNTATVKDLLDSQQTISAEIKKHGNLLVNKVEKLLESTTSSIQGSVRQSQRQMPGREVREAGGGQRKKKLSVPMIKISDFSSGTTGESTSPSSVGKKQCTIVEPDSEGSSDGGFAAKRASSKQEQSPDTSAEGDPIEAESDPMAGGTGGLADMDAFFNCLQETIVGHFLQSRLGLSTLVEQLVEKHLFDENGPKKRAEGSAGLSEASLLKEQVFSLHSENMQLKEMLHKVTSAQAPVAMVAATAPVAKRRTSDAFKNNSLNCGEAGGDAAAGTWQRPESMSNIAADDALEFFMAPIDRVDHIQMAPTHRRPATAPASRKFSPRASGTPLRDTTSQFCQPPPPSMHWTDTAAKQQNPSRLHLPGEPASPPPATRHSSESSRRGPLSMLAPTPTPAPRDLSSAFGSQPSLLERTPTPMPAPSAPPPPSSQAPPLDIQR